jgi:hypothetical protein
MSNQNSGVHFVEDIKPHIGQFGAGLGIVVGAGAGVTAATQTGDLFRFAGTALFLAITVPLFLWKYHFQADRGDPRR